jgi:hypothetical protein
MQSSWKQYSEFSEPAVSDAKCLCCRLSTRIHASRSRGSSTRAGAHRGTVPRWRHPHLPDAQRGGDRGGPRPAGAIPLPATPSGPQRGHRTGACPVLQVARAADPPRTPSLLQYHTSSIPGTPQPVSILTAVLSAAVPGATVVLPDTAMLQPTARVCETPAPTVPDTAHL